MAPRRYNRDRRNQAVAELRHRIVEATVGLHAEQGIMRTTYAMIARRADVAIATVYNHFPKPGDLLAACTGHVLPHAPPLGPQMFEGVSDVDGRLDVLVRALHAFYRYCAPWMRWSFHEARFVPEIAPRFEKASEQRRALIELALTPAFGPRAPEALVALCEILLDFSAWERLARNKGLAGEQGTAAITDALITLTRVHAPIAHRKSVADRTPSARARGKPS